MTPIVGFLPFYELLLPLDELLLQVLDRLPLLPEVLLLLDLSTALLLFLWVDQSLLRQLMVELPNDDRYWPAGALVAAAVRRFR